MGFQYFNCFTDKKSNREVHPGQYKRKGRLKKMRERKRDRERFYGVTFGQLERLWAVAVHGND